MKSKLDMKMKHYLTYSAISFLILIIFIAGADALTAQQWREAEICHPIRLEGYVSPDISANITVKNPKNEVIVGLANMTYNATAGEHCYTVPAGYNSILGEYPYTITATGNGLNETASYSYQVTPGGETGLLGFFFIAIILSYGLLGLGIYKQDITISILGTFGLYFLGMWILFYGIDIYKNFLTNAFSYITLGVAFYVSARMAYEYLNE